MSLPILEFSRYYLLDNGAPIELEDWQVQVLKAIFGAVDTKGKRVIHEVLVSTGKKGGKTELLGLAIAYMLLVDPARPAIVIGLANDKEQGGHAFLRVARAFQNSPTLAREVDIKQDWIWRADGRGYYKVVSSDVPSAGGERPSMLAIDEIGMFRDWRLIAEFSPGPEQLEPLTWHTGYRGPSYLNTKGCPMHDILARGVEGDPRLFVYDFQGNPSSWSTAEFLAEKERQLPRCEFRRLYLNEWASGEDSFLTTEQIERAVDPSLDVAGDPDPGCVYLAGLDLGLRSDRSALAIVAVRWDGETYSVALAKLLLWEGTRESEVQIAEVQAAIEEAYLNYRFLSLSFDPWQGTSLAQSLAAKGDPIQEFRFTQSSLNQLARGLYEYFVDGRIRIPNHTILRHELANLVVEETAVGIKWRHMPHLHDDAVTALALAMSPLFEVRTAPPVKTQVKFLDGGEHFDSEYRDFAEWL